MTIQMQLFNVFSLVHIMFSPYVLFKGATKSYQKIIFVSATKVGKNKTTI